MSRNNVVAQLGVNYLYTPRVLYHPENNHVESYVLVRMSVLCIAWKIFDFSPYREENLQEDSVNMWYLPVPTK